MQPIRPFLAERGAPVAGLRVAYTTGSWFGFPIDPEMAEAVQQVAAQCEAMAYLGLKLTSRRNCDRITASKRD
jgi:Asp-tRNA(Asn)/Glu-tRNA(Gln) amidotransferase A subunit family amidase